MKRRMQWPLLLVALMLTACATQRPVVYPNANVPGDPQVVADRCMQEAEAYGLDYHKGGELPRRTVEGGVIGGASGAVVGAIVGNTGRGAAIGAAHGATHGLLRGLFAGDQPAPVYRRYVEHCLRERGYQPIGWQ